VFLARVVYEITFLSHKNQIKNLRLEDSEELTHSVRLVKSLAIIVAFSADIYL
jgi:hypothetical protein